MKFVIGSREGLAGKLKNFSSYYIEVFSSPNLSLLVFCAEDDDNIVAACSIGGAFNLCATFVKDQYRGQGIATQTFEKMISEARKRGINFITGTPDSDHVVILHILYKLGFRPVVSFREFILVVLPLSFKGELLYGFLRVICSIVPTAFLENIIGLIRKGKLRIK